MIFRTLLGAMLLLSITLASILLITGASATTSASTSDAIYQLVLNIYANKNGTDMSLITGYISDPAGLPFLRSSDHIYENDTGKIYAMTGALLSKIGADTDLDLDAKGHYDNYHVTFYLPIDASLKRVDCPSSLDYATSASKDSLVVDIQGFNVDSPHVSLQYQL